MSNEIQFIRECAARGLSKSRTAELVGVWPASFGDYLECVGLGDLEFVNGYRSISANEGKQRSGLTRTGVPQTYLTEEDRQVIRQRNLDRAPKYTAFGVTGTLNQLAAQFGVVSKEAVRLRVKGGMSMEDALKTPRSDFVAKPRKNPDSHPWRVDACISIANHRARQEAC